MCNFEVFRMLVESREDNYPLSVDLVAFSVTLKFQKKKEAYETLRGSTLRTFNVCNYLAINKVGGKYANTRKHLNLI